MVARLGRHPNRIPSPAPTIGWLAWHIGWWWNAAIDHIEERTPPTTQHVDWPGDGAATLSCLRQLRGQWLRLLRAASLA